MSIGGKVVPLWVAYRLSATGIRFAYRAVTRRNQPSLNYYPPSVGNLPRKLLDLRIALIEIS